MARRKKRRGLRGLGSPLTTAVNTCANYEAADKKRGFNTAGTRGRMYTCVVEELRSMSFEHGSTAPSDMYKYGQITRGIASAMRSKKLVDNITTTQAARRARRPGQGVEFRGASKKKDPTSEMEMFNDLNRQGFMRNVYAKPKQVNTPTFGDWKVDVTVGGELVKTIYLTAWTSKEALANAKAQMRGAVSSAGAFKFNATRLK